MTHTAAHLPPGQCPSAGSQPLKESERSFKERVQDFWLVNEENPIRYGMGCAWLGKQKDYRADLEADLLALHTAYQMGVRYFDTAAAYGSSERVVGEFVASIPRESIFLASKFNLPPKGTPQEAAQHARRSLEESLRRLKTDHLDLFQAHDFTSLENVLAEGGALDAMLDFKQQGMVRYIGAATRQHWLLEGAIRHGGFDTILTFGDYTFHNQSAAALIELANHHRLGVINASPLLGAHEMGLDLSQPSFLRELLTYPLRNPGIDINLTGPANAAEVKKNFLAIKVKL
jgi:aryl-alcohol dehydrogenase-like predicted oxidoreductase